MRSSRWERELLLELVIASLVKQLGGEARVPMADLAEPLKLEVDDDPLNGDWIYRIREEEE